MITLEDKLDTFHKIVYKAEEERSKLALEELEKTQKSILEDKILEFQNNKEKLIDRRKSQVISEKNEMLSESIDRNRKKSLVKRETLLENLIESLEIKTMNFTDSDEYIEYLIARIQSTLNSVDEGSVILGLKRKDSEKIKTHIKSIERKTLKHIELTDAEDIVIGGFKVWNSDKSYTLDNTFKTIIEENRYEIGKKLYIALNKEGESDE